MRSLIKIIIISLIDFALIEKKNLRYCKSEMAFESGIIEKCLKLLITTVKLKALKINQNQKVVRSCKLNLGSIK